MSRDITDIFKSKKRDLSSNSDEADESSKKQHEVNLIHLSVFS